MLRTATSGTDVHHDEVSGQGTVGGWLVHPGSGARFGFSNCHVMAALGRARLHAPLYQQGRLLGHLHSYLTLDQRYYNAADIALFSVDPTTTLRWAHPPPMGNTSPGVGMRVYKHGAGTGLTRGAVIRTGGTRRMVLGGQPFWFDDIITITGFDGLPFSGHGDSGALVMWAEEQYALAILLGKHPTNHEAYAFPISAAAPVFAGLHYAL
ncbi:MAG: hypothetical protein IPG74_01440 [Flavobacteriales bacterium]|nr:hypothetical protein [Flavobacteriales bacterium]